MIADAMQKVGNDGVITVEDGTGLENELELVEGMKFDKGWISPYFVNKPEKQMTELEKPLLLVANKTITSIQSIIPVLEEVAKTQRALVIIAEEIDDSLAISYASGYLGQLFEGEKRFLDDIVNGIWAICEETYWGVPAHISLQASGPGLPDVSEPTVDLFAAETSALLAWCYYLLGDKLDQVSPLVRPRIELEIDRRILTPCFERDDFWWMGFGERKNVNNWNPWICSNWLTSILLIEKSSFRRSQSVYKAMRTLDNFIRIYPDDGGCDEGPGYWGRAGASLFDCLELLYSASNGAINIYDNRLIKEIGRYIYRAHIADDYFINFADASAITEIAADLTYRYGKRIKDPTMMAFAAYANKRRGGFEVSGSISRALPALFNYSELTQANAEAPYQRDVWLPDLQVMVARSKDSSPAGLFLAAKGGHNDESHNHNDVGSFIVYYNGRPVIIDVGVETYTRKTFSSRRYEIWTMQSAFHNLPTIAGVMQAPGRDYAAKNVAYSANEKEAVLQLDIASAYPKAANLKTWQRHIRLERGIQVQVSDTFELNTENETYLSFMTPLLVDANSPGKVILSDKTSGKRPLQMVIEYDNNQLSSESEDIDVSDKRLQSVWGMTLRRVKLRSNKAVKQAAWSVQIKPLL